MPPPLNNAVTVMAKAAWLLIGVAVVVPGKRPGGGSVNVNESLVTVRFTEEVRGRVAVRVSAGSRGGGYEIAECGGSRGKGFTEVVPLSVNETSGHGH